MAHVFDVQSLKEEHLSPAACHGAVSRLLGRRWSLQPSGELLLSLCLSCWSINLHLWKERAYLLGLGIGVPRWAVVSWSRAGSEKQAKPTSGRACQATIHFLPICQYTDCSNRSLLACLTKYIAVPINNACIPGCTTDRPNTVQYISSGKYSVCTKQSRSLRSNVVQDCTIEAVVVLWNILPNDNNGLLPATVCYFCSSDQAKNISKTYKLSTK